MIKIDGSTSIISVKLININDGAELELLEKVGSKCLFRDKFEYEGYVIQLRLDFNDIKNGEPILDADIWQKTAKENIPLKNGPWHHSKKTYDKIMSRNIYIFEFQNLRLCLGTITTAAKDIHCKINIKLPNQKPKGPECTTKLIE